MELVSPTILNLIIFVLAIYVGYHVVWTVTPALHTPLMAVTNAISAIVIVGAMLAAALTETGLGKTMGVLAVALAAVNIFGGFLVTRRMLEMFKKKEKKTGSRGGQAMSMNLVTLLYLVASVCFIQALKGLSHPTTSIRGNLFGMIGMAIAVLTTAALIVKLAGGNAFGMVWVLVGLVVGGAYGAWRAKTVEMTKMPELVAFFHSMIGLAAVFIAVAAVAEPWAFGIVTGKGGRSRRQPARAGAGRGHRRDHLQRLGHRLRQAVGQVQVPPVPGRAGGVRGPAHAEPGAGHGDAGASSASTPATSGSARSPRCWPAGLHHRRALIIPIGGADMPVVVSMLNSYSGWAAAGIGFSLNNSMLIIAGSLVGSSGAILSYIMCKAMNRSFFNVILGGFGGEATTAPQAARRSSARQERQRRRRGLRARQRRDGGHRARLRPGGGARAARGQGTGRQAHRQGHHVKYAIHPVAGRMPGHMNVLLAEAEVPYDQVFEMEDINGEFGQADVAIILGANDVVNPAAHVKGSAIYGMPILEAYKAKTVIVNKRSMASGYAGLDNELFYMDKTMMVFGDAKKVVEDMVKAVE
jgi:NAD(P) transhydrogenase subunit beta